MLENLNPSLIPCMLQEPAYIALVHVTNDDVTIFFHKTQKPREISTYNTKKQLNAPLKSTQKKKNLKKEKKEGKKKQQQQSIKTTTPSPPLPRKPCVNVPQRRSRARPGRRVPWRRRSIGCRTSRCNSPRGAVKLEYR